MERRSEPDPVDLTDDSGEVRQAGQGHSWLFVLNDHSACRVWNGWGWAKSKGEPGWESVPKEKSDGVRTH